MTSASEMKRMVILGVDDDPLTLAYLETVFLREGFEFVRARDAAEAIKSLERKIPDLLIVDVGLQGASGLDLCRQVRAQQAYRGLPIVIYTGATEIHKYSDSDLYDLAFTKDTHPKVLMKAIRALLPDRTAG